MPLSPDQKLQILRNSTSSQQTSADCTSEAVSVAEYVANSQFVESYTPYPESTVDISSRQRSRTTLALTTVTVLIAAVGIGVVATEKKTCSEDITCRELVNNIGEHALLNTIIKQKATITTPRSRTIVLNLSNESTDLSAVKETAEYYEDNADEVVPSSQKVATTPNSETPLPKDVQYIGRTRNLTNHILLIVAKTTDMPLALLGGQANNPLDIPAGFTADVPDIDSTITAVATPAPDMATGGLNQTADDILKTEICQATIDVQPTEASATDLNRQLGQETACNDAGLAMQLADQQVSYGSYVNAVNTSVFADYAQVGYGLHDYHIYTNVLPKNVYLNMQSALS